MVGSEAANTTADNNDLHRCIEVVIVALTALVSGFIKGAANSFCHTVVGKQRSIADSISRIYAAVNITLVFWTKRSPELHNFVETQYELDGNHLCTCPAIPARFNVLKV